MLSYLESLHCFQTDFFTSKVIFFGLKRCLLATILYICSVAAMKHNSKTK